jgi:hypothetical protein
VDTDLINMATSVGYVSFDIETDGLLPSEFNDRVDTPPAVFCAATMELRRAGQPGAFLTEPARSWPTAADVSEAPMTQQQIVELVEYMWEAWKVRGLRVLAWNGAGFDLRILAAHVRDLPQWYERVVELAWSSCDPMFSFFMAKGFPVGLNAVARAGRGSVCKNGHGADVSALWAEGHAQRVGVLAYCCRDVEVTAVVLSEIDATGHIRWITKSGKTSVYKASNGAYGALASVRSANAMRKPDTSWMSAPIDKSNFVGWLH